jgi:hypothetical protein
MIKRPRRPRDANELGKLIVERTPMHIISCSGDGHGGRKGMGQMHPLLSRRPREERVVDLTAIAWEAAESHVAAQSPRAFLPHVAMP